MIDLLGRRGVGVLEALAGSACLLAFDFDGTLAPIVADRHAAALSSTTRSLLAQLSGLYPTAVISGRARSDVQDRLRGTHVEHVIGNHGQEGPGAMLAAPRALAQTHRRLLYELRALRGVEIEDKRYSLSIHYRNAHDPRAAVARIRAVLKALPRELRTMSGHHVVNVVPAAAQHKGDALLCLWDAQQPDAALYLGDDVTDEDVFALSSAHPLIAARVGRARRSAAPYFVSTQADVDQLLVLLIALRRGAT